MVALDGIPALIYAAFWQLKVDGRFKKAFKGVTMTVLFDFVDFPPAALLAIEDGEYTVLPVDDITKLGKRPDASIRGKMVDATAMLGGPSTMLKALLARTFVIKGKWKLLKLAMAVLFPRGD